jgi:hypothetical protein
MSGKVSASPHAPSPLNKSAVACRAVISEHPTFQASEKKRADAMAREAAAGRARAEERAAVHDASMQDVDRSAKLPALSSNQQKRRRKDVEMADAEDDDDVSKKRRCDTCCVAAG